MVLTSTKGVPISRGETKFLRRGKDTLVEDLGPSRTTLIPVSCRRLKRVMRLTGCLENNWDSTPTQE